MRLKQLSIILFLFISNTHSVYSSTLDSLKNKIDTYKQKDSVRCKLLILYSDELSFINFNESIKYANEALKLAQDINYTDGICYSYRELGTIYLNNSDYKSALENYQHGIKTAQTISDTNYIKTIEYNIGIIYLQMGEYRMAMPLFNNFLIASQESKNDLAISYAFNNMALCFMHLGILDSAEMFFNQVVSYGEKLNEINLITYGYVNLGAVFDLKGEYKTALGYFEKAYQLSKENNIDEMIIQSMNGIAEANLFLKNYDVAADYAQKAIELSGKAKIVQNQIEGYKMLADIFKYQNKFESALNAYQNYILLKDSVTKEEKKAEILRKDLEFKNDMASAVSLAEIRRIKERNNLFLIGGFLLLFTLVLLFIFYKRTRDVIQKNKETAFTLKETAFTLRISETELKALRAQMNPHFLNNAFSSIHEFVRENKPDQAEKYLLRFSKLMRAVLDASEKKEISLSHDLEILEWYMEFENLRFDFPFKYQFVIDESIDRENTFIPPMLMQPLVENAIKHGLMPKHKQASGNISIIIEQKNEVIYAIVEDDGVGRNLNRKVDDPMLINRKSMGMKITRDRLNILNAMKNFKAELKIIDLIKDNQPSGTRVELTIPFQI